jgi:hypothetical protein
VRTSDHRLRIFEKKLSRGIFGPNREEVSGGWRELQSEKLYNLYLSPDVIRLRKSRMR